MERLKTIEELDNFKDWLLDKNGHVQYINIARCLMKIVLAQDGGEETLKTWVAKEGGNGAEFFNFLLHSTENKFPLSNAPIPSDLQAVESM